MEPGWLSRDGRHAINDIRGNPRETILCTGSIGAWLTGAKDHMSRGALSTGNLQKRGSSSDHAVVMQRIEPGAARVERLFPTLQRLKTLARRGAHRRAILALFAGGTDGVRSAAT